MEGMLVTFLDQTGAKAVKARVSAAVTVAKILPNIITKMALPVTAPDGTPMSYSLDWKEGGKRLAETQTLADAGVLDGAHLIVYPEVVAGGGPIGDDGFKALLPLIRRVTAAAKSAHGRRCPGCKEAALLAGYTLDDTTLHLAAEAVEEHCARGIPEWPSCRHPECIQHVRATPQVARQMMRLAAWGVPKSVSGIQEAHVHFECHEGDAPEGFVMARVAVRYERWMRPANTAGGAIIEMKKRGALVHVTVDFDGPTPTRAFEGPKAVEIRLETVMKNLQPYARWARQKCSDLLSLADMEAGLSAERAVR
jgi:hypothetical protein